jgi:hypothetical protein
VLGDALAEQVIAGAESATKELEALGIRTKAGPPFPVDADSLVTTVRRLEASLEAVERLGESKGALIENHADALAEVGQLARRLRDALEQLYVVGKLKVRENAAAPYLRQLGIASSEKAAVFDGQVEELAAIVRDLQAGVQAALGDETVAGAMAKLKRLAVQFNQRLDEMYGFARFEGAKSRSVRSGSQVDRYLDQIGLGTGVKVLEPQEEVPSLKSLDDATRAGLPGARYVASLFHYGAVAS